MKKYEKSHVPEKNKTFVVIVAVAVASAADVCLGFCASIIMAIVMQCEKAVC